MQLIYYLHVNGDIVSKNPEEAVEDDVKYFESSFVKKVWKVNLENREDAWVLIIEALALGAQVERVRELSKKWKLTSDDLLIFFSRHKPSALQIEGVHLFIEQILEVKPDAFFDKVLGELAISVEKSDGSSTGKLDGSV